MSDQEAKTFLENLTAEMPDVGERYREIKNMMADLEVEQTSAYPAI